MPDQEKEKLHPPAASAATETPSAPKPPSQESEYSQSFFGETLVGLDPSELNGTPSGLRRSNLVGRDIDQLLAKNAVTRLTLALMYATDFFDQLEHRIIPALRSGAVVLADRFIFTLIARGVVRGINRDYLTALYAMALRPHLTFWLNVRPETAFAREFKKSQAISYWEAGRDMSLSHDLYWSFVRYQTMIKREFEVMGKKSGFIELDGESSVSAVNKQLRLRIGEQLGIRATKYAPSAALAHLWR